MEPDYIYRNIGKKIRELRDRNGLTQQELADRTELTKGYISQLERGQVAPSVVTLLDLIECLGTTAADFFRRRRKSRWCSLSRVFREDRRGREQHPVDRPHRAEKSDGTAFSGAAASSEIRGGPAP